MIDKKNNLHLLLRTISMFWFFLFQDNWKANITFVVGDKVEDYTWINILGETVAAGSRKLFSVISREALENEVRIETLEIIFIF